MKDGRDFYYTLGNIVDFVDYPLGYEASDVAAAKSGYVKAKHGQSKEVLHGPKYSWCLYEESSATLEQIRNKKYVA